MLFGKKKEDEDNKQISAVKENTPPSATINSQTNHENSNVQENSGFTNPFSDENKTNIQQNTELNSQTQKINFPENNLTAVPNSFANLNETAQNLSAEEIQEMIDETVEKVIEERWEKLITNVEKISKWREQKDEESNMLKSDLVIIKENFEKLEKKLFNKINDYDRNILDVNSEIKALEKVFQKITPTLINNVNELSRIASDFKYIKENKNTEDENSKTLEED